MDDLLDLLLHDQCPLTKKNSCMPMPDASDTLMPKKLAKSQAFGKESLGIIEMGGGSTQVSFELKRGEKDWDELVEAKTK